MSFDLIENEYIRGGVTYRELSQKYAVSLDRIKKAASRGKWREKRSSALEDHIAEVSAQQEEPIEAPDPCTAQEDLAPPEHFAEVPERTDSVPERLRALSGQVEAILCEVCSDREQFFRHLLKEKNSDHEYGEYIFRKADTKALVEITAAIKNLAAGCRDLSFEAQEKSGGGVIVMPEILCDEDEEAEE